jgi:hypothetical protein
MSGRPDTEARVREREHGLLRQRSITRRVFAVTVGGLAAFAGLAGVSKATQSTPTSATIKAKASATPTQQAPVTQAPATQTPGIVAPVTPVTPTYTPPVTSSGGS